MLQRHSSRRTHLDHAMPEWLAALGNAGGMAEWTNDSNAAKTLAGRLRNEQA